MKRSILVSVAAIALVLSVSSCRINTASSLENRGTLILSVASALGGAKTLTPPTEMIIYTYVVKGSGPRGAQFEQRISTGSSTMEISLQAGAWLLTVDGENSSGTKIASGNTAVTIVAGQTVTSVISVTPLSGNGVLKLSVSWPAGVLISPSVSAALTPVSGASRPLTLIMSADQLSASYEDISCATGYYMLSLELFEGNVVVWGCVETVRIVVGDTTQGSFMLSADDINAVGNVAVQVTPALDNPITIALSGQSSSLNWGRSMNITATPSFNVDSLQWYLNGSILAGAVSASISVGSSLQKGNYRLDVVVAKSGVLSSAGISFKIVPVSIDNLIQQISDTAIYDSILSLQNIGSREYGSAANLITANYLFSRLSSIPGLQVAYEGGDYRNVVAALPASGDLSTSSYIVGAHYDTVSGTPGALDNGCGVALVLEMARLMSQYRFEHPLIFSFWNDEEAGALGSNEYAAAASQASLNIGLYVNLDSAGYDPNGQFVLDIMSNNASLWAKEEMTQNNSQYGINFVLTYNIHDCLSDHASFWNHGYPAIMTHEQIHGPVGGPEETIDKVSISYAMKNVQLCMSLLAEMASRK